MNVQIAFGWLERGIVPIRIITNGKKPAFAWKEWQNKLPSKTLVKQWFGGWRGNIAIVTGGQSGLVVVDFDSFPKYLRWKIDNPELAKTYTVNSPRPGRHCYFFVREPVSTNIAVQPGIDIKANGGYVLIPPSRTEKGFYTVAKDAPILTVERFEDLKIPVMRSEDDSCGLPPAKADYVKNGSTSSTEFRLPRGRIAEIKSRLSLYDLAARYTELHSTSNDGRFYTGICPAHEDHAPSFRVDTFNNLGYCYSGGCKLHNAKGCDVIDFYQAVHEVNNRQAIYDLSQELGLCE